VLLVKLFPYILFERYIYILAFEMASRGTSTVPIVSANLAILAFFDVSEAVVVWRKSPM